MQNTMFNIGLALLLCVVPSCGRRSGEKQPPVVVASSKTDEPDPSGYQYPPARWRLAMFDELDRATLWVGHIAIRHRHSQPDGFRILNWRPDPPNPDRSVADALALAEGVARLAANNPDEFEALARKYSEDIVTSADGGTLGGVRASQLQAFDFLDALVTLKPGEVSKPFRTPYGFHILKRYPAPPEQEVAGERIVIGYRGVFGPAGETQRTRAEAEHLARAVSGEAQKNTGEFHALVEQYSESSERVQHGDLGVFSTSDPAYLPVEVHCLEQLAVGEVTDPHDSSFGFEILKRVPVVPRETYAMAMLEVPFDASPTGRAGSQAEALKRAEALQRQLAQAPQRFEELQRAHRSERVERWTRGRGDPELTRVLAALPFGAMSPKPLLYGSAYVLLKRLDPSVIPPEKPRLVEIPLPSEPNYEQLLKYNDAAQVAGAARALLQAVEAGSGLAPEASRRITETLAELASTLERQPDDPAAVRASIESALAKLEDRLGKENFAVFRSFARRWAIRQVMPSEPAD